MYAHYTYSLQNAYGFTTSISPGNYFTDKYTSTLTFLSLLIYYMCGCYIFKMCLYFLMNKHGHYEYNEQQFAFHFARITPAVMITLIYLRKAHRFNLQTTFNNKVLT
jgi:hypothetical protein